MDFITAAMRIPNDAHPYPAMKAMKGTSNMPHDGFSPKTMATSSGAQPNVPARVAIHSASAVTISSVSTGAASSASYVLWNWYLTNVPNIAGKTDENSTAVATVPVPTNCT